MQHRALIAQLIAAWAGSVGVAGKTGKRLLQPSLANALRTAGFSVDEEDHEQVLRAGMPVWRSKDSQQVEPTTNRRRIDLVVYRHSRVAALIEAESDLNDLRTSGVARRSGHYDVASIAASAFGSYFDSYKSLERMAAAAYYWHLAETSATYPSSEDAVRRLEAITSDDAADHNPAGVPIFLVSGSCRISDQQILARRLSSLDADLVCVSAFS